MDNLRKRRELNRRREIKRQYELRKKQQEIQKRIVMLQRIIQQYDQVKRKLNHAFISTIGIKTNRSQFRTASNYIGLLHSYKIKSLRGNYYNENNNENNNENGSSGYYRRR